jgi:hypothetical protein
MDVHIQNVSQNSCKNTCTLDCNNGNGLKSHRMTMSLASKVATLFLPRVTCYHAPILILVYQECWIIIISTDILLYLKLFNF